MQLFTGRQYLEIDIASNFGLDKSTWSERLAWFDENHDNTSRARSGSGAGGAAAAR